LSCAASVVPHSSVGPRSESSMTDEINRLDERALELVDECLASQRFSWEAVTEITRALTMASYLESAQLARGCSTAPPTPATS
jgi:hypothetical protein